MSFSCLLTIYIIFYGVFGVIERGWVFYIPPSKRTPYFKEYYLVMFGTLATAVGSPAEKLFIGTPDNLTETFAGFTLFGMGLLFRYLGKKELKERFTVQIVPGDKLIKEGIYKVVRHPLYLGLLLICLSSPLIMNGFISLIFTYLAIPFIIYSRIKKEEGLLIERFGDEYIEYMREVPALFPLPFVKRY